MIGTTQEINRMLSGEDRDKVWEIKEYHPKRSLNANSYAWVLISKIADVLRANKDDIYLKMLEDYGQSLLIPVEVGKQPDGFFKYFRYITTSPINGKNADWYKVSKGSSNFDSREMAIFIDGIVSEAHDLEIETIPPRELMRLKEMWK